MVIASEEGNQNFYVSPARLTQIENEESVPSFYKLFSLCSVYGLDLNDGGIRQQSFLDNAPFLLDGVEAPGRARGQFHFGAG